MLSQEQRFHLVLTLLREGVRPENLGKEVKSIDDTVFGADGCTFVEALGDLCERHGVYLANVEDKEGLSILPIESFAKTVKYKTITDGQIAPHCY